jgi:hypothetical protein
MLATASPITEKRDTTKKRIIVARRPVFKKLTVKDSNGKIVRYGIVYPTGLHRYAWRQAYIMGYSDGFSLTNTSINNKERYINLLNFIKDSFSTLLRITSF